MNLGRRSLRALRQALVATNRAGAIVRFVHKESPLARNEADLAHLNIKKSSEGAVAQAQEPLVSDSRAALAEQIVGVGAQIAEVAGSIKSVQGQIVEVADKVESTRFALDQADLLPDKREVLMLVLRGLMEEKKGLMDKEKGLMEEKKGLMEEKKGLMEEKKGLTGTQPLHSDSSDARQSWWGWFKEDWRNFAMSLGFIASAVAAAASFNKDTNRSVEVLYQKLSNSLAEVKMKRQITHASRNYVVRPELEAKILSVYDKTSLADGTYWIVYGVKGAGKTSAVDHALGDKAGVVLVRVSENDSVESIIAKIFEACGVVVNKAIRLDQINEELYAAMEKRNGRPMTVLFEVERGSSSPNVLSIVKHTAKEFALFANVLIVLSEANAVLGFGDDPRQKFILVGEMTREEARGYVQKRAPGISSGEFDKFADKCGTYPLMLGRFCTAVLEGATVDEHIGNVVESARRDLVAFIHSPILIALKKSPGGVHFDNFKGVEHKGILLSEPKLVAPAMKLRNTIMYDFEAREYKLFSKAHQTALETYVPPLP